MDNVNTHTTTSLYEAFEPEKAYALAGRLEIHHAPKHGFWLNIAQIELSCLTKRCLGRRIADLDGELTAWAGATNTDQRQVDWGFTTSDAQIKLRHLDPALHIRRSTRSGWPQAPDGRSGGATRRCRAVRCGSGACRWSHWGRP